MFRNELEKNKYIKPQSGITSLSVETEEIGRAHVWTPVTVNNLVCRPLLEKKNTKKKTKKKKKKKNKHQ